MGTSMMMESMQAGGMKLAYDSERERLNTQASDENYKPNECLYEFTAPNMRIPEWPLMHDGCCIKSVSGVNHLLAVNHASYRVIMMRRDFEETRQSLEAAFGYKVTCQRLDQQWDDDYFSFHNRRDVADVQVVRYYDMICNPVEQIRWLTWPVNAEKAAQTVKSDRYRFRREDLTVGI